MDFITITAAILGLILVGALVIVDNAIDGILKTSLSHTLSFAK